MGVKAVVILLIVVAVIVITSKLISYVKGNVRNAMLTIEANQEIDTSLLEMTDTDRRTCVSKLRVGFYSGLWGCSEDEDVIYAAFEMIPTRSDLLMVIKDFGVYKDMNLMEHINKLLSQEEIEHINGILIAKQINYTF